MDPNERLGYQRELQILKGTSHPFIIKYKDEFLYKENNSCIVTQFASGGDLKSMMERQINFTEDEAMNYFTMILVGLHYLHKK